jgi:hypothetical protein
MDANHHQPEPLHMGAYALEVGELSSITSAKI